MGMTRGTGDTGVALTAQTPLCDLQLLEATAPTKESDHPNQTIMRG